MNQRAQGIGSAAQLFLLTLGIIIFIFLVGGWIAKVVLVEDLTVWMRDWYAIWKAGFLFTEGRWSEIYVMEQDSKYYWLYPPYALYLTAALGILSPRTAYLVMTGAALCSLAAALVVARLAMPRTEGWLGVWGLTLASAATIAVMYMGQNSATLLLIIALGLWAWMHEKPLAAAALWALLGFKPNWVIPFVIFLIYKRQWGGVGVMAVIGALMILSTLPLGTELWENFFHAIQVHRDTVVPSYPAYKLITLSGFWSTIFDDGLLRTVSWALSVLVSMVAALAAWTGETTGFRQVRQVMSVVLLLICVNTYVSFYDALVLALPAGVWWMGRDSYSSNWRWWGVGCVIGGIWAWQWLAHFLWKDATALSPVGLMVGIWLWIEGLDLWLGHRRDTRGANSSRFVTNGEWLAANPR